MDVYVFASKPPASNCLIITYGNCSGREISLRLELHVASS